MSYLSIAPQKPRIGSWVSFLLEPLDNKISGVRFLLLEKIAGYLTGKEVRKSLIFFSQKVAERIKLYPSPHRQILFAVNWTRLFNELAPIAKRYKCEGQIVVCDMVAQTTCFQRDVYVALPNGSCLFPQSYTLESIRSDYFQNLMTTLCDQSMSHYFNPLLAYNKVGVGFMIDYQEKAVAAAQQHHLPIVQSQCCLEGGNVIFFQNSLGTIKAIVGWLSLAATFVSLQTKGYFNDKLDDPSIPILKKPSEEALLLARNYYGLFAALADKYKYEEWALTDKERFFRIIKQPLNDEERSKFHAVALKVEKKLFLTKALIQKELGVDVVFPPQYRFHIDMEISVGQDNTIFVHDDILAVKVLEQLLENDEISGEEEASYRDYLMTAQERLKTYSCDETVRRLEKFGCKVVRIAGIYEGAIIDENPKYTINFMNAIRLGAYPKAYVTNSCPDDLTKLRDAFFKTFRLHNPRMHFATVGGSVDIGDCLTKKHGGLRCMTSEVMKYVP